MSEIDAAALESRVESLFATPVAEASLSEARDLIEQLLSALETGALRAAVRDANGTWNAVPWVKRGILLGFRFGALADLSPAGGVFSFVDKDTYPPQTFSVERNVRVVPGGSTIRRGAFIR